MEVLVRGEAMTTLTVELPPEAYRRLHEEAHRQGKSPQLVAQEWLIERLAPLRSAPDSTREQVRLALRAAGLLVDLSPDLRLHANSTIQQEDVEASPARAGGKALSEIVREQRGPKG
jgi:predicted transcriptional regulator